jgi:hypothetical protein
VNAKLLQDVRVSPDQPGRTDEVRVIKGHIYVTREAGCRNLVRVARSDYPEFGIAKGDVYVEALSGGSHESGERVTWDRAIELEWAYPVDVPTVVWNRETRAYEPFQL